MIDTVVFFFNDTATTEIYTLSLHDALPISRAVLRLEGLRGVAARHRAAAARQRPHVPDRGGVHPRPGARACAAPEPPDRKSTRLNSSHANISYAVFCLKKKNMPKTDTIPSL